MWGKKGIVLSQISKEIGKGAAWMVAFKFLDKGIGLISTVVLARLLVPGDFGLIAMAMGLIAALQLLFAFSFDVHLIQKAKADRADFDTAWTCSVIFGVVIALLLASLAHFMSGFYREPRLESLIYALAIGCALSGFSNIGPVMFRRDMRFDREFKFMLGKRVAPLLITIPIAAIWHSYWALAIGQLSGTLMSVGLSYYMSTYRPRFSLERRAQLFHASKWLVINNLLQFLNGRAAEFVIGRFAGSSGLGLFTISREIATLPTSELVAPINRAAFPGYARLAHDKALLRNSFLDVISMIAVFAVPAGLGIAILADLLVPAALGRKWMDAIPVIQVLAVYGVIRALQTNISYIYLATGRPRLITLVSCLQFIGLVLTLLPATYYYGSIGACWAFLVTTAVMAPFSQYLIKSQLELSARGYWNRMWRPVVAGASMVVALYLFKGLFMPLEATVEIVAALLVCVALGALVYGGVLYGLWRLSGKPEGAEKVCLAQLAQLMRRVGIKLAA